MLTAFILLCTVAFLFYHLFFAKTRSPQWWVEHGIPVIDSSTIVSALDLFLGRKTMAEKDDFVYTKMGTKSFCGVNESPSPIIFLKDVDLIKKILIKDFDHFVDRRDFFPIADKTSIFSKILGNMEGEEWKNLRQSLSPTFTTGKIRRMMEHFNSVGREWVQMLLSKAKENGTGSTKIDVLSTMNQFTVEVIATSVFGMKTGTVQNPNSIFAQKASRLANMDRFIDIIKMNLSPRYPKLFQMLGIEVLDQDAINFFVKILRQSLEARLRGEVSKKNDFQQLLIDARKGELKPLGEDELETFEKEAEIKSYNNRSSMDKSKILTDDVIVAQSVLFFLAGFTAVANFITSAAYCLALNQDIQDKLREEVDKIVKEDGSIDYDDLAQLTYMDMVACEVLRKFPGGIRLERVCQKDYHDSDSGVTIKKDTVAVIPVHAIHNDKKYYENPDKFDPEHFSPEKKGERSPYTFLAFGAGPRNCIGKRFGQIEGSAAIAHLVHNFRIEPTEKTPSPLQARCIGILVFPPKNLELLLTPLK